jgi:hypothetical protein
MLIGAALSSGDGIPIRPASGRGSLAVAQSVIEFPTGGLLSRRCGGTANDRLKKAEIGECSLAGSTRAVEDVNCFILDSNKNGKRRKTIYRIRLLSHTLSMAPKGRRWPRQSSYNPSLCLAASRTGQDLAQFPPRLRRRSEGRLLRRTLLCVCLSLQHDRPLPIRK